MLSFFTDSVSGKKLTFTLLMFITGSQIMVDELKIEFNNDPKKSLLELTVVSKLFCQFVMTVILSSRRHARHP